MKKRITILLSGLILLSIFTWCSSDGDKNTRSSQLMVGTAIRNITPTEQMFPIWRRKIEIVGVLDSVHLRVIALSSGEATTLIICSETGRGPYGPQYAKAVAEHTGLPLEAIFLTTSHSHAVPEITERINLYFEESTGRPGQQGWSEDVMRKMSGREDLAHGQEPEVTNLHRWGKYVMKQMLAAADEALGNMQPASVGIGYSESYINLNRLRPGKTRAREGSVSEPYGMNLNPRGVSDKEVAAIRFNDHNGNPIAFIINYAVHGIAMHANTLIDGKTGISSDIPGFVSGYLEDKYDGSVAMWLSGAAGDQAPVLNSNVFIKERGSGEYVLLFDNPYFLQEYLSKIHYSDIEDALARIESYNSNVRINYDFMQSSIPAKDNGDYPISLQMIRIGDIALAGFHGEMFTSVGMDMKENSLLENTLVVTHTWQREFQEPEYHADDVSMAHGGFGTTGNYKPGYLSNELISILNSLIEETDSWTFNGDGTATGINTGETVIVGLDGRPGTIDDNRVVNPAGTVLIKDVDISYDENSTPFIALGNGFNLYAGVDSKIGTTDDIVKGFGRYPQSDITGIGTDPLDWRLLDIDEGKAIIACDKLVTAIKFNLEAGDGNKWIDSNLRSWLNSTGGQDFTGDTKGFYNSAFSEDEKAKIVLTDVFMKSDTSFIAYNRLIQVRSNYSTKGTDTQDYIWTLSGEEFYRYFGVSEIATKEETDYDPVNFTNAYYKPSDYAHAKGVKVNTGHNGASFVGFGDAWTRSPGAETDGKTYYGVFLGSMGSLNSGRPVNTIYGAIPVVTVDISNN